MSISFPFSSEGDEKELCILCHSYVIASLFVQRAYFNILPILFLLHIWLKYHWQVQVCVCVCVCVWSYHQKEDSKWWSCYTWEILEWRNWHICVVAGIDHDHQGKVTTYDACQRVRHNPATVPLHPWEFPKHTWDIFMLTSLGTS